MSAALQSHSGCEKPNSMCGSRWVGPAHHHPIDHARSGVRVAITIGMAFLETRPLDGVEVSIVSEVPELLEVIQTTLRLGGVGTITAATSCGELMKRRSGADAIIVDTLTRDLDVRFLAWANDRGAAVVALTSLEDDPRPRPDWLKAFNVRRLHSTDVRALCNAVHNAVVRL